MVVFAKEFKVEDRVCAQHVLTDLVNNSEIQSLSLIRLRSVQGLFELFETHLIVEFSKVFHIWSIIDQII